MEQAEFERTVARLERCSALHPLRCRAEVAGLALVGFALLGFILLCGVGGLLLLIGIAIGAALLGSSALLLLATFGKLLLLLAVPLWSLVKSGLAALTTRLPWQQRFEAAQAQRARLAELHTLAQPKPDERFELLDLACRFEREADHGPALAAFSAEHPEHMPGLFLLGCWQLDHGDPAGLEALDRAAALDNRAVKAVCERARAFCRERGDDRAAGYEQRWHAHDRRERERDAQAGELDLAHELRAPDLTPDEAQTVRRLLAAHGKGVARAWLVRRVLPADPALPTCVLGLRLTWWAARRGQGLAIIARLAGDDA